MGRQKPEYNGTNWPDIAQCVPAWEAEKGVRVSATLRWAPNLRSGAFVEVVVCDAAFAEGSGELLRVRHAFPTTRGSGHAGAVLYAIFDALNALDANPWYWSEKMRRERLG